MRQVVFTDVLIVGRLDVDGQGLPGFQLQNKSDNSSYRRDFSIYRKEKVSFQLKIRGASEKFKNQPPPLLRPTSVNFCQNCRNLSHETVPLKINPAQFLET